MSPCSHRIADVQSGDSTATAICVMPSLSSLAVLPDRSICIRLGTALLNLNKAVLDSLQVFADQLNQYFTHRSAASSFDDHVIGSKFFGAKSTYGSRSLRELRSEASGSSDDSEPKSTGLDCSINLDQGKSTILDV